MRSNNPVTPKIKSPTHCVWRSPGRRSRMSVARRVSPRRRSICRRRDLPAGVCARGHPVRTAGTTPLAPVIHRRFVCASAKSRRGALASLAAHLTLPAGQATMVLVMVRKPTSGSRRLAGALALVLAVVSSATCFAASIDAQTTPPACCAAMAGGCGSAMAVSHDCCAVEQPGLPGLAPLSPVTLAVPVAMSAILLSLPPSQLPLTSAAFDPDSSHPISPPPYLLDSVFRI
jgi:hypothetical protein